MYSLLDDSASDLRSKKFKKLTKAICGLVSFSCFLNDLVICLPVARQWPPLWKAHSNPISLERGGGWGRLWAGQSVV